MLFYTPEDFQVYDPLDDDYGTNRDYKVEDIVNVDSLFAKRLAQAIGSQTNNKVAFRL